MLKSMARVGTRLYRYTVTTWDEKPQFRFSRFIGAKGAQDPGIQIYLIPAPTGGPGKKTDNPNISDIYRWTDWGTKKTIIFPNEVGGDPLTSGIKRAWHWEKRGGKNVMVFDSVEESLTSQLHFPGYNAKTFPGAVASFDGGPDTTRWTKTGRVERSTRPRYFTRIIQAYLQKRLPTKFIEAVNKGRARGMRGEKG